jgi:C1A family cysteine protease
MDGTTMKMGINRFADMHAHELESFLSLDATLDKDDDIEFAVHNPHEIAPVDWRDFGAVNEMKDQGACGSCWAFSATGAMEGAHYIATGELINMAESLLVDCNYGILSNHGCSGGLMNGAFKFLKKHKEILEEEYPYEPKKRSCAEKTHAHTEVLTKSYKNIKANDTAMKAALAVQPVAIAIQANQDVFMKYQSGIITGCVGKSLDHGILAIGWGIDETHGEYYIVRNSWGTRWGEGGYAKVAIDGKSCGMLTKASVPTTN